MAFQPSPRSRRVIVGGTLAGMAALSVGRLLLYDPIPWTWVAVFAVGTSLLVGPVSWVARDRLPVGRRERLGYVAAVVGLLCFPVVLGVGLVFGNLLLFLDTSVFGGVVGLAGALVVERALLPNRLRGSTL